MKMPSVAPPGLEAEMAPDNAAFDDSPAASELVSTSAFTVIDPAVIVSVT